MTNATILPNGVSGYVTSTAGTVTNYIRADALSTTLDIAGGATVTELGFIDAAAGSLTAGIVTGVTVTAGGSDYSLPPVVSFTGGAGTGATAIAVISGGVVTSVEMTNVGTGYTSAPTVVFTNATGDTTGSGATATAAYSASVTLQTYLQDEQYYNGQNAWSRFAGYVQQYNSAGEFSILDSQGVVSATITSGGTYSVLPTGVTFTSVDGNGSGATATVAGTLPSITSITITATGSGYTQPPTIAFTGGTSTAAATATANLGVPQYTTTATIAPVLQALQESVVQLLGQSDLHARND